jgi:quercetin dioxygenase-like cupin family protein
MKVKMDDGTEVECKAGDVAYIPAGHDAWVVGNEDVISIDFDENTNYAKPKTNN